MVANYILKSAFFSSRLQPKIFSTYVFIVARSYYYVFAFCRIRFFNSCTGDVKFFRLPLTWQQAVKYTKQKRKAPGELQRWPIKYPAENP